MIRNVYAWSIYYSEINRPKIDDENTFLRAGDGILKLATQDDPYSPYTATVMKILDYLSEKPNYPTEKMLEWTAKLNPKLLDNKPYSFTDKDGKPREIASKQEQYYMLRTRALLEKGEFAECINLCEEALHLFERLHYDNDVWFRWRIALSYEGLGECQRSLKLQLELLKRKREWFIQKEIAEQYYRLGEYEKSLQYALDSALNFGDSDKKINTYIVLADALEKLGKNIEAQPHKNLVEKIRRKEDIDNEIRNLRIIWNSLKYSGKEKYSGVIKSILPNGKAGFVECSNGQSYYFLLKELAAQPHKAHDGTRVTFYLEDGFDAKKNKKVQNAVKLEPIIS
jgi:tetratricopeptide (TPR) repeat protein